MSRVGELLISFESYCGALAEGDFAGAVEGLADGEYARVQGRALFREYLARCTDLAQSDYIGAKYCPSVEELAKHETRGAKPTDAELEQAKLDTAILEFYRQLFGPDVVGDCPLGRTCPDWQTAVVNRFETKETYLQAVDPITKAHKNLVRQERGLDSYLNVLLMMSDAYGRARERMFDMGFLIGRYKISSELWEEQGGEFKFQKTAELNKVLAERGRRNGFVYLNEDGNLVHSYRFAATIQNAGGEKIVSQEGDLSPVLLAPRTFVVSTGGPSQVASVEFGQHHRCRLSVIFNLKAGDGRAVDP